MHQPPQSDGQDSSRDGEQTPHDSADAEARDPASGFGDSQGAAAAEPGATGSDVGSSELRQLDPRWITAERISGAIFAGVVVVGALIALLVFARDWKAVALAAWVAITAVLLAGAMVGPALQYRRARYRVTPFGIEIRWGVVWRRITIVPRSRIQHTDVEQGPLLGRFGLAKLVIHTAGTEHSTVPLHGLAMPDATAIRDDLMGRGGTLNSSDWSPGAGDGV